MNIIDMDSAAQRRKKRNRRQYYVTPIDNPPAVKLLMAYRHLWQSNPLWLKGLHPTIPNPRKYPEAAMRAAFDLLRAAADEKAAGQGQLVGKAA